MILASSDLTEDPYKQLSNVYQLVHSTMHSTMDCRLSGTTCSGALLNGRHVILANVGDSRAIVVNDMGIGRQLTIDHKPELPEER